MADDVHISIHTSDRCTRSKLPQEETEMQPILVSYPLELIHLDFLTLEGNTDDNRSVNILVVMDHFTKYVQQYVTPKQTAPVVAQTSWDFLVHYGSPENILTDEGKSFENSLIRELCKLAQVKRLHTSPYQP